MKQQIVSEFRKLRTTRSAWSLLAGTLGLIALGVVAVLWESNHTTLAAPLADQPVLHIALSLTWVFVMILGLRSFTDEFRNGSIVPTLLADPHRRRVLAAKLAAVGAAAVLFTFAVAGLTLAIWLPWLAAKGVAIDVAVAPLAVWFGRLLLIDLLFAAIGVGVGLAVRHQVAAIVGSLVVITVVENLMDAMAPSIARFLPAAGAWAVAGLGGAFMRPIGGALVLVAWALGAVVVGAFLMERRDIV
jgi:ABC-type transport system involved in multi-copper enzyme maturation permease subunit